MKSYHDIERDGGSDIAGQVSELERKLATRLQDVRHIVAIMSGKGGVGKSATTVSLATALALRGVRVGIVDADVNGASVVRMTGVERAAPVGPDGVQAPRSVAGVSVMSIDLFLPDERAVEWSAPSQRHAYAWRGMVEVNAVRDMIADTNWGGLDLLLVDLPPGTDKLPNLNDVVDRLSAAVVVTIPSPMSAYVVRKSIQLARQTLGDRPLGLVENMSSFLCDSCGKSHDLFPGAEETVYEGVRTLGRIPFEPAFGADLDAGRPHRAFERGGHAATAYADASESLLTLIGYEPVPA